MADAVSIIKTLLSNGWTSSNTDSITPTFDLITNQKQLDLRNNDYVLLYYLNEDVRPFGIGGQTWDEEEMVTIDIRTAYTGAALKSVRDHLIKVKDEVKRIIKSKVANPDASYQLLKLVRTKDLTDKHRSVS